MAHHDTLGRLAGRICLGASAAVIALGMYFGNVRFAPIALGLMILAFVCYGSRRREPVRASGSFRARPSLSSGDGARLPSRSAHPLGP